MNSETHVTVRSAIAPILGDVRIAAALSSQAVAGETLKLLEQRGDWLRVRSFDNYEGWIHVGYVSPLVTDVDQWLLSLGCTVREPNGGTKLLPFGARVAPTATVVAGETVAFNEQTRRFPMTADAIAASAAEWFAGASYQWGGITPWGCDCSGFVQRIFLLHGVVLPRDAWQQALIGVRVAEGAEGIHSPGDLLFFSDRTDARITHVGIALDRHRMVHSSLRRGGIAIEQLAANDAYVATLRAQCVGVQRVL